MEFKTYKNTLQRPCTVYADFERSIKPNDDDTKICKRAPNSSIFYFGCT